MGVQVAPEYARRDAGINPDEEYDGPDNEDLGRGSNGEREDGDGFDR